MVRLTAGGAVSKRDDLERSIASQSQTFISDENPEVAMLKLDTKAVVSVRGSHELESRDPVLRFSEKSLLLSG